MKQKKYTITCNEEQLRLIAKACELSSRLRSGQLHYIDEVTLDAGWNGENRHVHDHHVAQLKELCGLLPGASHGISGSSDTAKNLYDIYRTIYEYDAKPPSVYSYVSEPLGKFGKIKIKEETK